MLSEMSYLSWRRVGLLTPLVQLLLIAVLYVLTVFIAFVEFRTKGTTFGYPLSISILFVPIYEEILFRGFVLGESQQHMSKTSAVVLTSILFGVWHLKNIFFLTTGALIFQICYVTFIFSPITCWLTLRTKTIWPAVILHYLNNLWTPFSLLLVMKLIGAL